MKNLTSQILAIINSDEFKKVSVDLPGDLRNHGFPEVYAELELNDAISTLERSSAVIDESIRRELFDRLSFQKRNEIFNKLNQIKSYAENVKNGSQNGDSLFVTIQELDDIIRILGLELNIEALPNYEKKLKEVGDLKGKYRDLVKNADFIPGLIEKIQTDAVLIEDNKNTIEKTLGIVTQNNEAIATLKSEIEVNAQKHKEYLDASKESNQDIENKKASITAFFTNIEDYKKKMGETDVKATEIIETMSKETRALIDQNNELEKQVKILLDGAVAGNLFEAFNKRKDDLEKNQIWFFILIIAATVATVGIPLWLFGKINGFSEIDSLFLIKLSSTIPLVLLDLFFVQQYNFRKRVIEEYAFKSAVSLSFKPYKELVKEDLGDDKVNKFISDSIDKIYTSPLTHRDGDKNHPAYKILEKLVMQSYKDGKTKLEKFIE